ncbi:mitochondrial GTPase 1 homolog (S. cerevisiae), isoform CRA_b [Mus musculus]|nr:mitochondrial GTPase 1 homolog (S. cerevisiae), isoform CRA_b [Mus musculus]
MRLWPQAWGAVRGAWRECFPLQGHDVARWFPGHMAKENCPALRRKRPEQRSLHELCER